MADVIQQNIPVDVCEYDVECSECRDLFGPSQGDHDIVRIVKADVFERIVVGPFVDVDAHHTSGSFHTGEDGQYGCSATHIEQLFADEVQFEHFADHQVSRFVIAGPECHLRIDDDVIGITRLMFVE